jgi:hypothetical protein
VTLRGVCSVTICSTKDFKLSLNLFTLTLSILVSLVSCTAIPYIIVESINKASKKDALTERLFLLRYLA